MGNKIKFGLKNVHYAKATIASDGSATYATPVAIPGAVNLTMDPEGDSTTFFADNVEYATFNANAGYSGNLEIALVPESFSEDILGDVEDQNGLLVEDANAPTVHFALLFEFDGDVKATKHVLYNCTAQRPSINGQTKTTTVDVNTETLNISAKSIHDATNNKDWVKAKANEGASKYSTWYESVAMPSL